MTFQELVRRTADRTGATRVATRRALDAFLEELVEALERGDTVALPGLGRLESAWRERRTMRSVDGRKIMLDGRYVPKFRPSETLRDRMATRTPQTWRDPEHQRAWRLAETLVGDLALYHGNLAPNALVESDEPARVQAQCATAFGGHWERVVDAFRARAPGIDEPYLALAAQRRWARP